MLPNTGTFCYIICFITWCLHFSSAQDELDTEPIFLTVSSLYRVPVQGAALIDREIQLNWEQGIEEVALFTTDPTIDSTPEIRIRTDDYPDGMFQTNVSLDSPLFPAGWEINSSDKPIPGDHCLNFWIGAYSNGTLEQAECLRIRPTWMSDNRPYIGSLPLTSLFIPGTHNSGCYKRGESLSQRDTLARYLLTQDQDIWSQLIYGIRYIDLRVGIYPVKSNNGTDEMTYPDSSFWVNHDLIKVRPLVPILRDIKQFLSKARGEIVILDLHRFPVGFTGRHARHTKMVELLEKELKDIAIPFEGGWPTLDKLWQQDKQLIIAYGDKDVAKKYDWLWPPIRQQWANQQSIQGLFEFIESCMNNTKLRNPRLGMWASMAQLTASQADILFNPTGSLRKMAQSVNQYVTKWFKQLWWQDINIVTSDFFLGNNLISVAIEANINKGSADKRYEIMN